MYGTRLTRMATATAGLLALALAAIFFYAPTDADQGLIQKIFYIHVPMAIVALCGFIAAGGMGIAYLRSDDRKWDLRSYVTIHISIVFAVAVLVTGSLWARASWGHWWVWNEPTLVSFLIVFLLYCCYQPLRFSIEDPERQARYAAVFSIVAGGFVPLNFIAVRLAAAYTHPRVLSVAGGNMPGSMRLTFMLSLAAVTMLYLTLRRLELTAKHARFELRALRTSAETDQAAEYPAAAGQAASPASRAAERSPVPETSVLTGARG
jgi:heme exporter protein C